MGLRQHPGPLTISGFGLLITLIAGCALTPMPGSSFSGRQGEVLVDFPTGLKLPAPESPSFAAPVSSTRPTPVQAPTPQKS